MLNVRAGEVTFDLGGNTYDISGELIIDDIHGTHDARLTVRNGLLGETDLGIRDGTIVGDVGTGSLNIRSGGGIVSIAMIIGNSSTSTGSVVVDGSSLQMLFAIEVGGSGLGSLDVRNGGAAGTRESALGSDAGSHGDLIVDGIGSRFFAEGNLRVGNLGTGTVEVRNGGVLASSDSLQIGSNSNFIVEGTDSLVVTSNLFVGIGGTATIQNGGGVRVDLGAVGGTVRITLVPKRRFALHVVLATSRGKPLSSTLPLRVFQRSWLTPPPKVWDLAGTYWWKEHESRPPGSAIPHRAGPILTDNGWFFGDPFFGSGSIWLFGFEEISSSHWQGTWSKTAAPPTSTWVARTVPTPAAVCAGGALLGAMGLLRILRRKQ